MGAANLAEEMGKLVDADVDVSRVRGPLTAAGVVIEPVNEADAALAGARLVHSLVGFHPQLFEIVGVAFG